jgi:hypothetical protein
MSIEDYIYYFRDEDDTYLELNYPDLLELLKSKDLMNLDFDTFPLPDNTIREIDYMSDGIHCVHRIPKKNEDVGSYNYYLYFENDNGAITREILSYNDLVERLNYDQNFWDKMDISKEMIFSKNYPVSSPYHADYDYYIERLPKNIAPEVYIPKAITMTKTRYK